MFFCSGGPLPEQKIILSAYSANSSAAGERSQCFENLFCQISQIAVRSRHGKDVDLGLKSLLFCRCPAFVEVFHGGQHLGDLFRVRVIQKKGEGSQSSAVRIAPSSSLP